MANRYAPIGEYGHKARLFFEKMLGYANANSHASLEQREGTRDRAISCDLLSSRHTPAVS